MVHNGGIVNMSFMCLNILVAVTTCDCRIMIDEFLIDFARTELNRPNAFLLPKLTNQTHVLNDEAN